MNYAIAIILSFTTLASAAPGYKADSGATMWGSFSPEAYRCADEASNKTPFSYGTDTHLICSDQKWIDDFWCCLTQSTLDDAAQNDAWDTLVAQCQCYNVRLGSNEFEHARSAAATQDYGASNKTEIPTVTASSNETSASGVPSAVASEAPAPQATGAGSRPARSLAVLGAALAGAVAMLLL